MTPTYTYELRDGTETVATGQLSRDIPFDVGEHLTVNGRDGIIRSIQPAFQDNVERLIIELVR